MNKERKLIIAGNWKMNKTVAEALALVNDLKRELGSVKEVDIVVCPPYTALESVSKSILDSNLKLGAQNISENNVGAFTGEIAAVMLAGAEEVEADLVGQDALFHDVANRVRLRLKCPVSPDRDIAEGIDTQFHRHWPIVSTPNAQLPTSNRM